MTQGLPAGKVDARRAALLGLVGVVAAAACRKTDDAPRITADQVETHPMKDGMPVTDPASPAWKRAPEHVAKLLLQDQTEPKVSELVLDALRVRALAGGGWVVFRIQWKSAAKSELVAPAQFADAAAVQLPVDAGGDVPDGAMGQKGRPVRIHLWRADWQRRIGVEADAVSELYPHFRPEGYPYARVKPADEPAVRTRYAPARAAGNPVALGRPDCAIQDLVAEGFGTLTTLPQQISKGTGAHANGTWTVTIARPLDEGQGRALVLGGRSYVAFAVWSGPAQHVGARKLRTGWIPFSLRGPA